MKHYTGNYFCTQSNWTSTPFDARNLVSIVVYNKYAGEFNQERVNELFQTRTIQKQMWDLGTVPRQIHELSPEVVSWLNENVADQASGEKGWCCGNEEYLSHDNIDFNLFFYRRKDALKFIKTWSFYKKPTETYNQDNYVAKKLNLKTNKLEICRE